jgi:hypothetical protein
MLVAVPSPEDTVSQGVVIQVLSPAELLGWSLAIFAIGSRGKASSSSLLDRTIAMAIIAETGAE